MTCPHPTLDGYHAPFKGKRYWVIEIDALHPLDWVDSTVADYAIYDKTKGEVIATIRAESQGLFWVQMSAQANFAFFSKSLRESAQAAAKLQAFMLAKA